MTKKKEEVVEPQIKSFRYIRPNIVKGFTHFVLLYLTIKGYFDFLSSQTGYEDFMKMLRSPIIVDVIQINASSNCTSPYESITTTEFPPLQDGCRCDGRIVTAENCHSLESVVRAANNSDKWKDNCAAMNSYKVETLRILGNATNPAKISFDHLANLPKQCKCFENITGYNENKTIDIWFPNKKICIKRNKNISTFEYLQSVNNMEDCPEKDICQNYFCKTKFSDDPNMPCPLVDLYFDNKKEVTLADNTTVMSKDNSVWNMYKSDYYNRTFTNNATYENTVLMPIIGISISRNGKCVSGKDSLLLDYGLIERSECAPNQRYYTVNQQSLQTVLENNNYYSKLMNYQGFNLTLNNDNKWNLDIEYGFYRNTLTCLMNNYDIINKDSYFSTVNQAELGLSDFNYKKLKIGNILTGFLLFQVSFQYQIQLQITNLALNCALVFVSSGVITLKLLKSCHKCCNSFKFIFEFEIYFTFVLEVVIGIIGAVSYFILNQYITFFSNLIDSDCVDNYVQYKMGIFSKVLSSTADQNFEIFLIVIIKIFLILFSSFYYWCVKMRRLNCGEVIDIIRENINEGEEDDSDEETEREGEGEKDNLKKPKGASQPDEKEDLKLKVENKNYADKDQEKDFPSVYKDINGLKGGDDNNIELKNIV